MDVASIANLAAIALYAVVFGHLLLATKKQQQGNSQIIGWTGAAALLIHALGAYNTVVVEGGFQFGFFVIPTLFFWLINLLVLISGLRKPLHSLLLFSLPLTAVAILSSMLAGSTTIQIQSRLAGHIVLSLVAYSVLTIATLQALLLAYLNHQLKHKHTTNLVRILPPLETLEALMFELIWAGQLVLTLSIITGVLFVGELSVLFTSHHAVISVVAWLLYAVLLLGHHRWGWRGKTAVRWAVGGFIALVLAYFGTKFAFEIIFDKPQLMESSYIIQD